MRKIKFRGYSLDREGWLYGDLARRTYPNEDGTTETWYYINPSDRAEEIRRHKENLFTSAVNPRTIGQFTGLTDKNGKEIYEGDIIRIDCHPWLDWKELKSVNAEVVFENFAILAQWKNPDAGKSYGFPDDEDFESEYVSETLCNLPNTIEVIGNIHNNPIEE